MSKKNTDGSLGLCWIAGIVLIAVLLVALFSRSDLKELTETAAEISSVAMILDSPSGLQSLLISFANQCNLAQQSWIGALNVNLGLVFLACITGFALLVTLAVQLRINRQLTLRLNKLQQKR